MSATFDYTKTAATAARLLTRFGTDGVLTRNAEGTYNPATGTDVVTPSAESVIASVFDFPTSFIDGTLIMQGDKRAYMSADVNAPKPSDTLTWGGVTYRIINVKDLAPGGISVLFELQLRTQ